MTPTWAWPLAVLFVAGWVLATAALIGHVIRHVRKPPAPGQRTAGRSRTPGRPGPAPGPSRAEHDMLTALARARLTAPPQAVENSRMIADTLRVRFPHLDDATLGLITLELAGYVNTALLGTPDPGHALRVLSDAFSLGAEELTRLARQGVPR